VGDGCLQWLSSVHIVIETVRMKLNETREDGYEIQLDEFKEDKDLGNHYTISIPQRIKNMTNFKYTRNHLY
jgi:hypothetical protein